ncbi:hypothetical protein D3C87_2119510 [compost metagenome]
MVVSGFLRSCAVVFKIWLCLATDSLEISFNSICSIAISLKSLKTSSSSSVKVLGFLSMIQNAPKLKPSLVLSGYAA